MPALLADAGDILRDRIDAAEIVEQPRIDAVSGERRAHGREIEHACGNRGDASA
jgi:hypothetical protein